MSFRRTSMASARSGTPMQPKTPTSGAGGDGGDSEEASAAVRVYVRVRPFNDRERTHGAIHPIMKMSANTVTLLDPSKDFRPSNVYSFDSCFWSIEDVQSQNEFASQSKVYAMTGAAAKTNVLDGYNACIFAYGQTGSGKTFTMMGNISDDAGCGIIPRLCKDIFASPQLSAKGLQVQCTYLEIYNERVMDLLEKREGDPDGNLKVRQDPVTGPFVEGLSTHNVSSESDIFRLLHKGDQERHIAATKMNDRSSRSHAIFSILLCKPGPTGALTTWSKINLVDLAGSERVHSSGAEGVQFKEATKINLSLTTLGRVIDALADQSSGKGSGMPPYRESMLTWVLSDSLGGNSRTCMVAAVSPSPVNFDETVNTLRYASRAREIVNICVVNDDPSQRKIKELTAIVERLRRQLQQYQMAVPSKVSREHVEELEGKLMVQQTLVDELRAREEQLIKQNRIAIGMQSQQREQMVKRDQRELKEQAKKHDEVVEKLQAQTKDLARDLSASKDRIVALQKEKSKADAKLKQHEQDIAALKEDLMASNMRCTKLESQLKAAGGSSTPTTPVAASSQSLPTSNLTKTAAAAPTLQNTARRTGSPAAVEDTQRTEELRRMLRDSEESVAKLRKDLAEAQSDAAANLTASQQLKTREEEFAREKQMLVKKLNEADEGRRAASDELVPMRMELEAKQREVDVRVKELENARRDAKRVAAEMQKKSDVALAELNETLRKRDIEKESLLAGSRKYLSTIEGLKADAQAEAEKTKVLRQELEETRSTLRDGTKKAEADRASLRTTLHKLEAQLDKDRTKHRESLEALEQQSREQIVATGKQHAAALDGLRTNAKQDNANAAQQLAERDDKIRLLENTAERLGEDVALYKSELESKQTELRILRKTTDEQVAESTATIQRLERENTEAMQQLEAIQALYEMTTNDLTDARDSRTALEEQAAKSRQTYEALQTKIGSLNTEKEQLQSTLEGEIAKLTSALEQRHADMLKLKAESSEAADATAKDMQERD
eukprot:PhM_4_TR8273/c2_g1_i1/m.53438/K17914/KIF13; kinesin family member 13